MKNSTILASVMIVATIAGAIYLFTGEAGTPQDGEVSAVIGGGAEFVVPAFSAQAAEGERYFEAVCASCHGDNGRGSEQGPPLIHDIYNPGHHGDESFLRAVQNGVPEHHWPFGNMPPQKITRAEVVRIVAYIRELQVANGIIYRPHNM